MFSVDAKRIEKDLLDLSAIGLNEVDRGVYRQGFTPEDMEGRKWLMDQIQQQGFSASMDGAGNVITQYGPEDAPAVIIGSHLDSVPAGGIFDGTLGVLSGLECMRVIHENDLALRHPVRVIATSEEEGRFGGMLGAQALTGKLTLEWLEKAHTPSGLMLRDAMADCGMDYRDALHARIHHSDIRAFLELHVEQGPVLEAERVSIGVVEGISGVFKWVVRLMGKADHAGTAPMNLRSDAFMGAADFAHEIPRIIEEEGTERSRITIGRMELKPGYPHTVPGEVDFTIVGRDMSVEVMTNLAGACRRVLSAIARRHRLMFEYDELSWLAPCDCSPDVMSVIENKAKGRGYSTMTMPSGAGHDAQFFTDICPTGMIFVPSAGGISHAPDEWTHWDDVERGANVLLDTVIELAS